MDNITITPFGNDYVLLRANQGYSLFSIRLNRVVSEAVVTRDSINDFKAIAED
jgi:hypothetical protein